MMWHEEHILIVSVLQIERLSSLANVKFLLTVVSLLQELRDKAGSPLGSTGSVADSIKSESPADSVSEDRKDLETGVFILLIPFAV
jgi:hypothetical protein